MAHHADVERCLLELTGTVDVVVANPPYVPLGAEVRDPEVAMHDPAVALWSGPDGLDAMRVLERTAARLLRPRGVPVRGARRRPGLSAPALFADPARWEDVSDQEATTSPVVRATFPPAALPRPGRRCPARQTASWALDCWP